MLPAEPKSGPQSPMKRAARLLAGALLTVLMAGPAFAESEPVSESAAQSLSLLGTALPVVAGLTLAVTGSEGFTLSGPGGEIVRAGVVAGPALGHLYARRPLRALLGLGVRGAGYALIHLDVNSRNGAGWKRDAVGTLGYGLMFASMFADIAGAKASARAHNAALSRPSPPAAVAPMILLGPGSVAVRVDF